MSQPPIESHGLVGDGRTVALVSTDGTVDFLCLPRFDAPSVFAALLDERRGGGFGIAPVSDGPRHRQIYLPDSNVLLTRFLFRDGIAEISDFMPIPANGEPSALVRRAKAVRGEIRFRVLCEPRFDYARAEHRVEATEDALVFASTGPDRTALRLRASVPLEVHGGSAGAEFTLRPGESAVFVLEEARSGVPSPSASPSYPTEAFKRTLNFWRAWTSRSTYSGRWRETVARSALTLRMLFSSEEGSLVAAPTFGLPEEIGGERNWDYRYTWIRDASFTLYALMRLGYTEEAGAFMRWIERRSGELERDPPLQIMYGLDGRHDLPEEALTHLEGYRGSSPVRIGNNAVNQLQLDIYGELMDSVYLYDKYGEPISYDLWRRLGRLVDWVCANWRRPDEGIWETRGGPREFLHSRVMCWVAVDRAIRLARKRSLPAPLGSWFEARDAIYRDVHEAFWDPELGAFTGAKGTLALDAACLLLPLVRFIGPTDPRWLSTLRQVERTLVDDALVYRYRTADGLADGLSGMEGTFSMCSFWYAECLSRSGDLDQARFNFEKTLAYANHLGLFGEELGPQGEHLGNFPQAFTHLGLISAAFDIDRRLSAAGRAE